MKVSEKITNRLPVCDRAELTQYVCFAVVLVVELLFFLLEERCNGMAWFLIDRYLALPAVVFLTVSFGRRISPEGKKQLLLGMGMLGWFFILEVFRRWMGTEKKEIGAFFCAYAMFLPFAAVTRDGKRQWGLKLMAGLYLAVSLIQIVSAVLLLTNHVPAYLKDYVYWDGVRFRGIEHPNICAALFMIGMAFGAGMLLRSRNLWIRGALSVLLVAQFTVSALTNARTTTVFLCLMLGGIVFCVLRGRGWKRLPVALAAGLVVMLGLFVLSGKIFDANRVRLTTPKPAVQVQEQIQAGESQEQNASEASETQNAPEATQPPQPALTVVNGQRDWSTDIHTLNGRTGIWSSAWKGIRDNPRILLTGTEYVGLILSQYNSFDVLHTHNAWLEMLYEFGLPGFAAALLLTFLAVRGAFTQLWRNTDLWKCCISLLVLCLLGCSLMEPYLFTVNTGYHFFDFLFLLCVGYLEIWRREKE